MERLLKKSGWILPAGTWVLSWITVTVRRFDGLYGQDAYAYASYAQTLLRHIYGGSLPPPFFWPIGYPLAIAVGMLTGASAAAAGQAISILAGAAVVGGTFLFGTEIARYMGHSHRESALLGALSGLFALGCGERWLWSITVMSDTLALAWATWAMFGAVRYARTLRFPWLALSAGCLAWAVMTRWIYALLSLPVAVFLLPHIARSRQLRHALTAGLLGMAILVPQILLTLKNPDPVVHHPWLQSWNPWNAVRRTFRNDAGRTHYTWPVGLFYAKAFVSPRYLFPLLTPFLVIGTGSVWRRSRSAAVLWIGWIALPYGFLAGIPFENFRFTLTWLPAEAALTAYGILTVHTLGIVRRTFVLPVIVAVGVLAGLAYATVVIDRFIDRKDADSAVVQWVQHRVPPTARILTFEITLALRHYTRLETHDLFLLHPEELRGLLMDDRPAYVLLRIETVRNRWRGYPVDRNFAYLQRFYRWKRMGRKNGYTLIRIRSGGT